MPKISQEKIEAAFQKLLEKWETDRKAFEALPKAEQDRIVAEQEAEFLHKMGWGHGLLPMNFDPQKYGTLAA